VAAGIEEMVLHPDEPLLTVVRLTLALGIVLYLGGTDLAWLRATGHLLVARTAVGLLLAQGIVPIERPPSVKAHATDTKNSLCRTHRYLSRQLVPPLLPFAHARPRRSPASRLLPAGDPAGHSHVVAEAPSGQARIPQ
jgi:hypothetical protein